RKKTKLKFDGLEIKLRAPYVREHPIRSVVAFILAFPLTLLQLVYILRKHQIRIVNIHYPGPGFVYFAFCRWLLPIKLVISIHGGDVLPWPARGPLSPTLRLVFREADLVVAPSRWFLQRCNGLLPPSSARRIVVHNGIDLAELQSSGLGKWGEVAGEFI